jgi:hypothetical protein
VSPRSRAALAAAAALALAGCHTVRYRTERPGTPRRYERTVHFFAWGLAGKPVVDLDEACPEGVARIEARAGFGGWLAEVATLGLWAPRTVTVQCAEVPR